MPRGALHARGSLAIGYPPAFTRLRRAAPAAEMPEEA